MRPDHRYGPSTYSIGAADPEAGECGVAVQSKFLAVGAFVPWARGGTGAVATQAYAEITYGNRGLELLESGLSPADTIDHLTAEDEMRSHRQVGIVSADGSSATYTGEECLEYAVGVAGENFAAQGNILSNPEVPEAMAATFLASSGRLVDRLFAALAAGEEAGGEKRGMESAALLVVKPGGGYGGNHDRWLDLRVDHSDSPIVDLGGLLALHTLYFGSTESEDLRPFDDPLQAEVERLLDSIGWWDPSESLQDNLQKWLGWHNLEERWVGKERIDPVVLAELRGHQPRSLLAMIVDAACYEHGQRIPGEFDYETAAFWITQPEIFAWVGLHEPSPEEFDQAVKTFHLHELAVDDALRAHQRPKLETFDDTLFVVTKPARYADPVEIIEFGEILIFVDPDFVVAVRHGEASRLIEARHKLEADPQRLACGAGSVLHAILHQVVRDYAVVLDELGADIRAIEDDVFSSKGDSERIYRLKQEVLGFHEAAEPLEEPLYRLATEDFKAIDPTLKPYFRDVLDHLLRVLDRINVYRDTLTSVLAANLTQVSLRQNEDMRKISAYVAIAAIPTLLAGIWGMNFEHMPEISAVWGYPAALLVMGGVCLFLYTRFKKSGWL